MEVIDCVDSMILYQINLLSLKNMIHLSNLSKHHRTNIIKYFQSNQSITLSINTGRKLIVEKYIDPDVVTSITVTPGIKRNNYNYMGTNFCRLLDMYKYIQNCINIKKLHIYGKVFDLTFEINLNIFKNLEYLHIQDILDISIFEILGDLPRIAVIQFINKHNFLIYHKRDTTYTCIPKDITLYQKCGFSPILCCAHDNFRKLNRKCNKYATENNINTINPLAIWNYLSTPESRHKLCVEDVEQFMSTLTTPRQHELFIKHIESSYNITL